MITDLVTHSSSFSRILLAAITAETPVQHAQTMESIEEDRKLFLQVSENDYSIFFF